MTQLHRNDYSRMWLIENRAGPGQAPSYESRAAFGAIEWGLGDITLEYVPDPDAYGAFLVAGKTIGEPDNPSVSVTARYSLSASKMLKIARRGCDADLQLHMGLCQDPQDFNGGWDKVLILEAARPTSYGTTDLSALAPDAREMVNEEVDWEAEKLYEVLRITLGEQAAAEVVQEVIDITVCDSVTCGACGVPSDGCSVAFAVTLSAGGSPGLPAELLWTDDGGATWNDTQIDTLGANEDPSAVACIGTNVVVISEDSESLHYAPLADILDEDETWAEVTTGFVSTKGPLALFSAHARATWIVGEGGYIYTADDPTSGVEVQSAGGATTQDLLAIHGLDELSLVIVGASNTVLASTNGGESWSLITGPAVGVNLNAVWMKTQYEWIVGSAAGRLYYTKDSGETWTEKAFPGSGGGIVRDIVFSTPSVGWMAHDTAAIAGRILRTIDGGYSWYVAPEGNFTIPANDRIRALAVCESDPNVIFGAGLAGNAVDGIIVKGSA